MRWGVGVRYSPDRLLNRAAKCSNNIVRTTVLLPDNQGAKQAEPQHLQEVENDTGVVKQN